MHHPGLIRDARPTLGTRHPAPGTRPPSRHDLGATRTTAGIALDFLRRGRPQYLPLLLSDYGRDIVRRKYDAFSTDRAYANRPAGALGPVGALIDRYVLSLPIHAAMRHRLDAVVAALSAAVTHQAAGNGAVRVLSAPCGLCRDILTAADRLRATRPDIRAAWHALDLDAAGDVLPEAARRAAAAGVPVAFHRGDLFADDVPGGEPFHVVNCVGLVSWAELTEVEALFRRLRTLTRPGGTLIVDNWHRHAHSDLGADLEIHTRYHNPGDFAAALRRAGFAVRSAHRVPNGACTVYTATAEA